MNAVLEAPSTTGSFATTPALEWPTSVAWDHNAWHAETDQIIQALLVRRVIETYSTTTLDDDRAKFLGLVERWRDERGYSSFVADMVKCPSYREIIAMGSDALPHLFEQLRSEGDYPDHWDFALTEITGVDPVPEADYGYMNRIAGHWLNWAEQNGY